ncbi:MAG: APC family permease [Bacteroidales bacterium]|nr:APC family permease [Bacteroidales bacterium]
MRELQKILDVTRLKLNRHEDLFITPKFDVSLIVNTINDFISIPVDEYLLLFADLSDSQSKNALYVTNKNIIRIGDNGSSEISFEKIRQVMLDGPDTYSILLNGTRFFDFPDHQNMANIVIEFLADLQNIGISNLDFARSEIRYPKFADIIDAVITYNEKNKDSIRLEKLYFKLSDSGFKTRIEDAILTVKQSGNQNNQWEFFNENGEKYYSTDKVKDIAEKMKTKVIKPEHMVIRNGVGEMKPVREISQSEPLLKRALNPFPRIMNSSAILGGIVGLILGTLYFFMLQDTYDVRIDFIVAGLVLIAIGFISYEISKKNPHPAYKWVGRLVPIAGGISFLYGSAWFLIIVLAFIAGTALLSLIVGWILYQRSKN